MKCAGKFAKNWKLFLAFSALLLLFGKAVFYALEVPRASEEERFYFFSNETPEDIKRFVLKHLSEAQHSIAITTYALTDPHVLSMLAKKGKEGLDITLTFDKKATPPLPASLTSVATSWPTSLKGGLVHEKIIILDRKLVILGSANLTESSLQVHDNTIAFIKSPELAATLFEGMVGKRVKSTPYQLKEGKQCTLYLLPEGGQKALSDLIDLIDRAEQTIEVALFTFTHPSIVEALIAAHNRHVKVVVTLDHGNSRGASKKVYNQLLLSGITVNLSKGRQLYHHKWACIDKKYFVFGSANWTRSAFKSNRENLIILN